MAVASAPSFFPELLDHKGRQQKQWVLVHMASSPLFTHLPAYRIPGLKMVQAKGEIMEIFHALESLLAAPTLYTMAQPFAKSHLILSPLTGPWALRLDPQ